MFREGEKMLEIDQLKKRMNENQREIDLLKELLDDLKKTNDFSIKILIKKPIFLNQKQLLREANR